MEDQNGRQPLVLGLGALGVRTVGNQTLETLLPRHLLQVTFANETHGRYALLVWASPHQRHADNVDLQNVDSPVQKVLMSAAQEHSGPFCG